jgi:hypothetical protein
LLNIAKQLEAKSNYLEGYLVQHCRIFPLVATDVHREVQPKTNPKSSVDGSLTLSYLLLVLSRLSMSPQDT